MSSCHLIINVEHIPYGPLDRNDLAFKLIWKMDVPMKVKAFSRRCFINRIPTRVALETRGIISNSSLLSGFCGLFVESIEHLFLDCDVSSLVCKEMTEWIGWKAVRFDSLKDSFMKWYGFCNFRKVRKGKEGFCGWSYVGIFGW